MLDSAGSTLVEWGRQQQQHDDDDDKVSDVDEDNDDFIVIMVMVKAMKMMMVLRMTMVMVMVVALVMMVGIIVQYDIQEVDLDRGICDSVDYKHTIFCQMQSAIFLSILCHSFKPHFL